MTDYTTIKADWSRIPEYMRGSIHRYIDQGIEPGDFLAAVLRNDLKDACARADDINKRLLFEYVQFFYNYAPSNCWGSEENYNNWIKMGGLNGKRSGDNIRQVDA